MYLRQDEDGNWWHRSKKGWVLVASMTTPQLKRTIEIAMRCGGSTLPYERELNTRKKKSFNRAAVMDLLDMEANFLRHIQE